MALLLCILLTVVTKVASNPQCCAGNGCVQLTTFNDCDRKPGCEWKCWFKEVKQSKYTITSKQEPPKKPDIMIAKKDWDALLKKAKAKPKKKLKPQKQKQKISPGFGTKISKTIEIFKNSKDKAKMGLRTFDAQGNVADAVLDPALLDYIPKWIKTTIAKPKRRLVVEAVPNAGNAPYKNVGQVTAHMWIPWDELDDFENRKSGLDHWFSEYERANNVKPTIRQLLAWLNQVWTANGQEYDALEDYREEWAEGVDVHTWPGLPDDPAQMIRAIIRFGFDHPGKFEDPPGHYKPMYGTGTIIAQYPVPNAQNNEYFIDVLTAAHGAWNKVAGVPAGKGPNKDFYFRHIDDADGPETDPIENAQLAPAQFDRAWVPYLYQNRDDNSLHGADWSIIRWKVNARNAAFDDRVQFGVNPGPQVNAMSIIYRYDQNHENNANKMARIPSIQFSVGGYWVWEADNNGDLIGGCSGSPIFETDHQRNPTNIIGIYVGTTNEGATSVAARITDEKQYMMAKILSGDWDIIADLGNNDARSEYGNEYFNDYDEEDAYIYPQNEYVFQQQYIGLFAVMVVFVLCICLSGVIFCGLCGLCGCLVGHFGANIEPTKYIKFQV
eukprot:830959_1